MQCNVRFEYQSLVALESRKSMQNLDKNVSKYKRSPIFETALFFLEGTQAFARLSFWQEQLVDEKWVWSIDRVTMTGEDRSTWREMCPTSNLSTTILTWTDMELNPGLQGERPATNRL